MKEKKLNIGCGKDIRRGFVNVDYLKSKGVDVVCNLNNYPYPFQNNQFDEILAKDILEHLEKPDKCMRELWRISRNGCKIKIIVPHYSSVNAWGDMTHVKPFSQHSMDHFNIKKEKGTSLEFHQKEKFKVNVKLIIPRIYKILGVSFFIRYFPEVYERFFTYLLPIQGLEFYLETIK